MPEHQVPLSCGVLLIHGDPIQSFLLMKHADRWDLPKGHVDPGETELQCALREMYEETGIKPEKVTVDPNFRFEQKYEVQGTRYGGGKKEKVLKTLVIFLARVNREYKIKVTEHQDARWFPWNPPHRIQARTIDPLMTHLESFLKAADQTV